MQILLRTILAPFLLSAALFAVNSRADDGIGKISVPVGFRVELVYSVPAQSQGSWVAMTIDPQGRVITSDQYGGLYRVTPTPLGGSANQTKVEKLSLPLTMAQGLLCVDDALYLVVNGGNREMGSGLYRATDADGDDSWDTVELLRSFGAAGGEHGPHGVILGPDKKSLYFCGGNHTKVPLYSLTRVPRVWQEDQLLPRILDPRGHAAEIKPPGGWIARTDLDGNVLELFSVGFRNQYDIAFNSDGELFTFDADMEWDIGTPWYRPTRICHVTSGVDFGWRSGNGKWRPWYIDSLPAAVEVGPGSPTGLTFGYDTNFPEAFRSALFAADWSYGRILAVHLSPNGSSYTGDFELFATAMPLAVTDLAVHPQHGALYFTVGGRKSDSALYRVVYDGGDARTTDGVRSVDNPTPKGSSNPADQEAAAEARELRRELETLHHRSEVSAVDRLWPHLASDDSAIRSAARIALEHQSGQDWYRRALVEPDPRRQIAAFAAAARVGDPQAREKQVAALLQLDFAELPHADQLDLLRTLSLTCGRLGPLAPSARKQIVDYLTPHFPTGRFTTDRELADLLVYLGSATIAEPLVARMEQVEATEQAIDFAVALSALEEGWTIDLRRRLLEWFVRASNHGGGSSCFGYLIAARDRFVANCPTDAREQLAELIVKPLAEAPAELESKSRPLVQEWTLAELLDLVERDNGRRDYDRGRTMFAAASCYQCHRIGAVGSTVGPDLSAVGRRFGIPDLLRAIVEPDHQISDQYQQTVFESGGKTYVGRVTNLNGDSVHISTNILDPKSTVVLARNEIDDQYLSELSMMPSGLLNTLTADEVLDLLAYLRAGGQRSHVIYSAK